VTVRPIPLGFTVVTFHVAADAIELVTVRVHEHVASQPAFAMLGTFSVVGSPPVDGFAAV
jgi:hypothetical protein